MPSTILSHTSANFVGAAAEITAVTNAKAGKDVNIATDRDVNDNDNNHSEGNNETVDKGFKSADLFGVGFPAKGSVADHEVAFRNKLANDESINPLQWQRMPLKRITTTTAGTTANAHDISS